MRLRPAGWSPIEAAAIWAGVFPFTLIVAVLITRSTEAFWTSAGGGALIAGVRALTTAGVSSAVTIRVTRSVNETARQNAEVAANAALTAASQQSDNALRAAKQQEVEETRRLLATLSADRGSKTYEEKSAVYLRAVRVANVGARWVTGAGSEDDTMSESDRNLLADQMQLIGSHAVREKWYPLIEVVNTLHRWPNGAVPREVAAEVQQAYNELLEALREDLRDEKLQGIKS